MIEGRPRRCNAQDASTRPTRAIHTLSPRKERPLVVVNCAALPADLIESELFGREKGAFTGAHAGQIGRFELANHSTILLDEIGELPRALQAKLLRVIQDGEFERLGSPRTIKVDVRIIAATNRDLAQEVRAHRFRPDLYYRLNVFPVTVPPLRERRRDIPLLVQAFVARFGKKLGKSVTTIPAGVMKGLQEYPWPGNVRELQSVIERAVVISEGAVLRLAEPLLASDLPLQDPRSTKNLEDLERDHILQVLAQTKWRIEGTGMPPMSSSSAVAALDRLFAAAGAHAVYDPSELQRVHRDIHTAVITPSSILIPSRRRWGA